MKTKDNQLWFVDHDNEVYLDNREDFDTYLTKEDLLEMLKAIEDEEQGGVS